MAPKAGTLLEPKYSRYYPSFFRIIMSYAQEIWTTYEMLIAHHLEPPESFFLVYTRYIPGIYFSHGYSRNIPGISPRDDFRIKSCFHPFEYIYCFNEYVQCTERFCCRMKSPSFNVIRWYTEQWDIIGIYLVYARYMPDIFINLEWLIYQSKEKDGTANTTLHESEVVCTDHAGDMISFIKMHFLFSMNVWQVNTRCIPSIYISYLLCRHFAGLPGLPSALGGFIQLPNSVWLHCASCSQAKVFKGAEEDQVKSNVLHQSTRAP